ncbi:MAG: hypothetical protein LUD29_00080 [Clostridia bacterium]|nr:hypothetical protein [Clostridia bacterium]
MGIENVTQKILSDAEEEAERITAAAKDSALKITDEAKAKAEADFVAAKAKTDEKCAAFVAGADADARQEAAKITLSAKRRAIDEVYAKALEKLKGLTLSDTVELSEALLKRYAENGDEIVFAGDFAYVKEVGALSVVTEKNLKITFTRNDSISGGFILRGKSADKDLSYEALLSEDREKNEASVALALFNKKEE